MPAFSTRPYNPSIFLRNGHFATITAHILRKPVFEYTKSIEWQTSDGDLLSVDHFSQNNKKAVIMLHGLEGHSKRPYMLGMAGKAKSIGYDVLALNFRSCGGKMNIKPRFYHSGETEDLRFVVRKVESEFNYSEIVLIGFSLGGNVLLKYLGEEKSSITKRIKSAVAVSVPVDLATSALEIERFQNRLYLNRFLRSLKQKVRLKMEVYPGAADWQSGLKAKTFHAFDDAVTAPLHGFKSVQHYYSAASSLPDLESIAIPVLLLSSANDSFLSKNCFPKEQEVTNPNFHYYYPSHGGHVGFPENIFIKETFVESLFPEWLEFASKL